MHIHIIINGRACASFIYLIAIVDGKILAFVSNGVCGSEKNRLFYAVE